MFLTELDIVNRCLASVGMRRLTAQDTLHPAYLGAERTVTAARLTTLKRGWWFNRYITTLAPDVTTRQIVVPEYSISVRCADRNVVASGRYLWNRKDGTQTFYSPQKVEIVRDFDYEDIPILAADYIAALAVVEYYNTNANADPNTTRLMQMKVQDTWRDLYQEEISQERPNSLDSVGAQKFKTYRSGWGVNGLGYEE